MIYAGKILKIVRRTEGFINNDWTIHYLDGSTIEIYEIDGDIRFCEDDRKVTQKEYQFLESIPVPDFSNSPDDETTLELEWIVFYRFGKPTSIKTTLHRDHIWDDKGVNGIHNRLTGQIDPD